MSYTTKIDLCDGKYSVIYNFQTGQSECLRYGEKWRELCGDKMVLAMFDRIVELEEGIRQHLAHHENGCTYLSHLVAPNVEFSGGAPLHGAASAGTQSYTSGDERGD